MHEVDRYRALTHRRSDPSDDTVAYIAGGKYATRKLCRQSPVGLEKLPTIADTFQLVFSPVDKDESGSRDQILDRPRRQYLAGLGQSGHPSTDVHGDPCELVAIHVDSDDIMVAFGDQVFDQIRADETAGTEDDDSHVLDDTRGIVVFWDETMTYEPQWYQNEPDASVADAVAVGAGEEVTGVDASLR